MTIFLSYAHTDRPLVDPFVADLRRRGVHLWRDLDNLAPGQALDTEIAEATQTASGFVFVLTENAAKSHWVRETERRLAMARRARRPDVGVFPIFADPPQAVFAAMRKHGTAPDPSVYGSLGDHVGIVIDPDASRASWRQASQRVLEMALIAAAERRAPGHAIRIGLATRDGARRLGDETLDLLLDWEDDYPTDGHLERETPSQRVFTSTLKPAIQDVVSELSKAAAGTVVRFVPRCHLTMASAVGMALKPGVGLDLEVVEPHTGEIWRSRRGPATPTPRGWMLSRPRVPTGGRGLVFGVNITRDRKDFQAEVKAFAQRGRWAGMLYAEPLPGLFQSVLTCHGGTAQIQRLAAGLVHRLAASTGYRSCDIVHLFLAAPPGFALLLGQQLANHRPVQTYEWRADRGTYEPAFRLAAS